MDNIILIVLAVVATAPLVYYFFKKDKEDEGQDTETKGVTTLFVESSCKPVVEALVNAFHVGNPNARIEVRTGDEREAFEALLNDTSRLVVLPRGLTEKEEQIFHARYFMPRRAVFALDPQGNRKYTVYNNQARVGLGLSFTKFIISDPGNQIIAGFGLVPMGKPRPRKKVA